MPRRTRPRKKHKPKKSSYAPEPEEFEDIDDEFSTAVVDDDTGKSTKSIFRHPTHWERMFSEIIASGKFPYKTKSDFIRHSVDRQFRWIAVQEPQISCFAMDQLLNKIASNEAFDVRLHKTIEKLRVQVDTALARGRKGDAIRMLLLGQEAIERMPDTQLRISYMTLFAQHFGDLLEGAREPMMRKKIKSGKTGSRKAGKKNRKEKKE